MSGKWKGMLREKHSIEGPLGNSVCMIGQMCNIGDFKDEAFIIWYLRSRIAGLTNPATWHRKIEDDSNDEHDCQRSDPWPKIEESSLCAFHHLGGLTSQGKDNSR